MTERGTRTLAVRGATWATLGVGLQRGVQTISILILARLLVAEDFGLVAVALLILNLATRSKTLGLHTALVQHDGDPQRTADTCFIINGGLTAATLGIILLVSPLVSRLIDLRAGPLLVLMSLSLIPQALAAVPTAMAVKALNFRKQALIQAVDGLVSAVVAVVLAFLGFGPWALAVGYLTGALVGSALWWIRPVWTPRWQWDREIASQLVHAGVRIWSSGNLSYLIDSANRLLIGSMLGVVRLGNYEIISKVVHIPIQTILGVHDRVTIAAFCRERDDRPRIGRWFLRLSAMMLILSALIAGPLLCFPDILIPTLFGNGWEEAVRPARALALFALLSPLISTVPVYIAFRRTGLLLGITAVRTVLTIGALVVAAGISLTAVCAVESLAALVFAPVNVMIVAHLCGLRTRSVLSTLSAPLVGLGAFSAVALSLRSAFTGTFGEPGFVPLLGLVIPSAAALSMAVFAMRPYLFSEIRSLVAETFDTR